MEDMVSRDGRERDIQVCGSSTSVRGLLCVLKSRHFVFCHCRAGVQTDVSRKPYQDLDTVKREYL